MPGELIQDRYKIIGQLGVGTFGRVLECVDTTAQSQHDDGIVAIKVIRSVKRYLEAAQIEAEILQHIQAVYNGDAAPGYRGMKDFVKHGPSQRKAASSNSERSAFSAKTHCVDLLRWFPWNGHTCLVFEHLGSSLYDFLKRNNYRPFPLDVIRNIARESLEALTFLHETCRIIHTDLKLENILFVQIVQINMLLLHLHGDIHLQQAHPDSSKVYF